MQAGVASAGFFAGVDDPAAGAFVAVAGERLALKLLP
jgi:hypothetical protein